jgi:hypothetical protein
MLLPGSPYFFKGVSVLCDPALSHITSLINCFNKVELGKQLGSDVPLVPPFDLTKLFLDII